MPVPTTNNSARAGYLTPTTVSPPYDFDLARQINDLVSGVSGLPGNMVFPRWQPEPPTTPPQNSNWAAVGVTQIIRQAGTPYIRHDGQDKDITLQDVENPLGFDEVQEHETIVILTSFYGPRCEAYAARLRDGLHISQNWETARANGMALQEMSGITQLPEMFNERWLRRADLELRIRRQVDRRYNVYNILRASGYIQADEPVDEPVTEEFDTVNGVGPQTGA
jgi:hypothetical protein